MGMFTITNSGNVLDVVLTAFTASTTTGDKCVSPDLSPYDVTYYHNGIGAYPEYGDMIFLDSEGNNKAISIGSGTANLQMANLEYLRTDINGLRDEIICR